MTISLRAIVFAFFVSIALFSTRETGMGAKADSKIVVRIETASVTRKGGSIVIHAAGMGRTGAMVRGGGQLLRRGQKHEPNKDGLLEYDLYYVPPHDYSGDKLKLVKASLVETNVPPGIKGVRIYAEFNERNAMLPESKVRGRAPKNEGLVPTEEDLAARKKEPALTAERPKPKKEEAESRPVVQEKKSRGWNLNPFHRKPTPQPTPAVTRLKKPEPTPARQEIAQKKKELPPVPEEPKKKRGFNLNPFHRQAAPAPQTQVVVEEWNKPEAALRRQEAARAAAPKVEESAIARETPAPKIKKKSRGWNLNPFHRKPAEPEVNAVPPPQPKKPEPTRQEATAKKKESTPEATPKQEEAPPKKEEKKKKSKWRALNPLHWNNPFKRESVEPVDPAPER